jgi:periplasmic divalent cation tolerance protein
VPEVESKMQAEFVQILTTTATQGDAQAIADALVERRLAGCVQVLGPLTSTYRWEGRIERSEEWVCQIKTRAELYPQVEQAIRAVHKYQTPEILALPVTAGSGGYLSWLAAETSPPTT